MADRPAAEKTEPPTAERLSKARQEGKIPHSQELPSALVLGTLLVATAMSASKLWQWFTTQIEQGFALSASHRFDIETVAALLQAKGSEALVTMAPFLVATCVAAALGGVLSGGWAFSPKAVRLKFSHINPISGLRNLFSPRSLVHLAASLIKLAVITAIVVPYLQDKLGLCLALMWATPFGALKTTFEVIFGAVARIAVALVAVAIVDVLYQRWQHRRDLRMSRQEVKEERRAHEPAPEVQARIRSMQFEMIRKRMLQAVPKADVVVTNPTHVAVALQYDSDAMQAPQVVAKGGDYLCEKIKEIARAHNIPVLYRPELARTIYNTVDVGEFIPEPLYVAVAEVLAVIYRLRKQRPARP